jgi:hypothetical protein
MTPNSGSSLGGTRVTVTGTYFGDAPAKGTDLLVNGSASDIISVSETRIVAELPISTAAVHYLVLRVGGQFATYSKDTVTEYYAYKPVGLTPGLGPVRGGTTIKVDGVALFNSTFIGLRIGLVSDSAVEGIDFVQCEQGHFDPKDDTLVFVTPPALTSWATTHRVLQVYLNLNNASWSLLEEGTFQYYAPTKVESVSPRSGPTTGGTSITVTGSGFFDTGSIVGRIASHSQIPGNAGNRFVNDTDLALDPAVGEDLLRDCLYVNSTSIVCQTNGMAVTEVVDFSFTIDSPQYNPKVLFSNASTAFFFYNEPELFPGDPGNYCQNAGQENSCAHGGINSRREHA